MSAGVTVVAIVLGILAAWGWARDTGRFEQGVTRYHIVLSKEERLLNYGTAIAVSPDGSSIVYVGEGDLAPVRRY